MDHHVSVSGGKDSTATYLLAIERGRPFRALFADTGHEHPFTVEYVRTLAARTGGPEVEVVRADFTADFARKRAFVAETWPKHGVPQDRVDRAVELLSQPTGIPMLDLCILKSRFPSSQRQFCTEELKSKPLDAFVLGAMAAGSDVVSWHGVRAEESKRRAGYSRVQRIARLDTGRTLVIFRPILHWGVNAVWWMHERHGLKPNPLYGCGAERVGCWPCIHVRKDELRMIGIRDPGAIEKLREWEDLVAGASKRGAATFFAADKTPRGAALAEELKRRANVETAREHPHLDETSPEFRALLARRFAELVADATWPRAPEVAEWAKTARGGRQMDWIRSMDDGSLCGSDEGLCE